jgi:uroporphyrinogen-III synthase
MAYSHVLITRPEPEAGELARMLEGLGPETLIMPAFTFEPAHPGFEFESCWSGERRRLAIFSSTRAVEFGLRQLPARFLDGAEVAAIGPATGKALESAGLEVSVVPSGEFNSESMLRHQALKADPGCALIFAARGGRRILYSGLREMGWDVRFAYVYDTVPVKPPAPALEALRSATAVLSVWTSANALRQLSGSLDRKSWEKVCRGDLVVTSRRLAGVARKLANGRVHVTEGPGNEAIRDCIRQLI